MLTCYSNISDSFCEAYLALTKIHSFTSPTKILFFIEGGGGGGGGWILYSTKYIISRQIMEKTYNLLYLTDKQCILE